MKRLQRIGLALQSGGAHGATTWGVLDRLLDEVKAGCFAAIAYKVNQRLSDTVRSFGVLDDATAREDWGWAGESFGLSKAVKAFFSDVTLYPDRIESIEPY